MDSFSNSVTVNAAPSEVWEVLTNPVLISKWMGDREMKITIDTNWKVGSPIIIRGFHHVNFENKGTVLQFEPEKILSYTHLSSVSRLSDKEENYSVLEFRLLPLNNVTDLSLVVSNFPTETIRKHMEFYWKSTLFVIKSAAEGKIVFG